VNAIAPGFFPSKMTHGLLDIQGGSDKAARRNPSRRLGEPEDIAGTVVFLASRAGAHCNGSVITIDGGEVWARRQEREEETAKL
jgi:NAD(P)-dependent dehydrogenase (short-subunit alcohol dehydrogenase family)